MRDGHMLMLYDNFRLMFHNGEKEWWLKGENLGLNKITFKDTETCRDVWVAMVKSGAMEEAEVSYKSWTFMSREDFIKKDDRMHNLPRLDYIDIYGIQMTYAFTRALDRSLGHFKIPSPILPEVS